MWRLFLEKDVAPQLKFKNVVIIAYYLWEVDKMYADLTQDPMTILDALQDSTCPVYALIPCCSCSRPLKRTVRRLTFHHRFRR